MLVIDGKDFVDNLKKSGWTPPQVAAQTQESFGSNYFDYIQTKISSKDDEDGQVSMEDLLEQLHSAKQPQSQDQDSLVQKEDAQKKTNVTGLNSKEIMKLNGAETNGTNGQVVVNTTLKINLTQNATS